MGSSRPDPASAVYGRARAPDTPRHFPSQSVPSPSPFRQLVYGSSTPTPLDADALADILRVSRENNTADGVTGALLYADGNVMQVLEGAPEAVGRVFDRLSRDTRHHRILVLLDRPAEARAFPDWSMGLVRPDELPLSVRDEVRTLYELTEPGPGLARRLLAAFRVVVPAAGTSRPAR